MGTTVAGDCRGIWFGCGHWSETESLPLLLSIWKEFAMRSGGGSEAISIELEPKAERAGARAGPGPGPRAGARDGESDAVVGRDGSFQFS